MGIGKGAGRVTVPAVIVAVNLMLMAVSGAWGTGQLAALAVIGLLPMILLTEEAYLPAVAAYGATLACGLLFLPDKTLTAAYGLFFGWFPLAWHGLRPVKRAYLRVLIPWAGFAAAWCLGLWLGRGLWPGMPYLWICLAGQPAFFLYYYLYGLCVRQYRERWAARIGRGGR